MKFTPEEQAWAEKKVAARRKEHNFSLTGEKRKGSFCTLYIWKCSKCDREQTSISNQCIMYSDDCSGATK